MDEDAVPYRRIQQHLAIHVDPIPECILKQCIHAVSDGGFFVFFFVLFLLRVVVSDHVFRILFAALFFSHVFFVMNNNIRIVLNLMTSKRI